MVILEYLYITTLDMYLTFTPTFIILYLEGAFSCYFFPLTCLCSVDHLENLTI